MNPNHPKQPETTRKDRKKLQNDPKFHNWGSMEFPTSFRYFKFRVPNTQIWAFWAKKYWLSNLNKILHVPCFEGADLKFFICFWKFRAQILKFGILGQKVLTFNLNKISHVPYFKGAESKFDIDFWKIWTEIPNFGHFSPESINFLILTKFCLYSILRVWVSNLTFFFEIFVIS